MKIRLHVERLVLDGPALSSAEADQMKEALVKELMRLLSEGRIAPHLLTGSAHLRLEGRTFSSGDESPGRLAKWVAGTLIHGMDGER